MACVSQNAVGVEMCIVWYVTVEARTNDGQTTDAKKYIWTKG